MKYVISLSVALLMSFVAAANNDDYSTVHQTLSTTAWHHNSNKEISPQFEANSYLQAADHMHARVNGLMDFIGQLNSKARRKIDRKAHAKIKVDLEAQVHGVVSELTELIKLVAGLPETTELSYLKQTFIQSMTRTISALHTVKFEVRTGWYKSEIRRTYLIQGNLIQNIRQLAYYMEHSNLLTPDLEKFYQSSLRSLVTDYFKSLGFDEESASRDQLVYLKYVNAQQVELVHLIVEKHMVAFPDHSIDTILSDYKQIFDDILEADSIEEFRAVQNRYYDFSLRGYRDNVSAMTCARATAD